MPFRLREHTADIAVEATGAEAGSALAAAATGVTAVQTEQADPTTLVADAEMAFTVEAPDMEALAVAFLSEILWQLESEDLLWVDGAVDVESTVDGFRAHAVGRAVCYDPETHGRGTEVKAITYHELVFEQRDEWFLRVILDI